MSIVDQTDDASDVRPEPVGSARFGRGRVLTFIALSIPITTVFSLASLRSPILVNLMILGVLVAMLCALAMFRFEYFVLFFLGARPMSESLSLRGISASVALGGVVLLASGAWVLTQWLGGVFTKPSKGAKSVAVFAGALTLSSLGSGQPGLSLSGALRMWSVALLVIVVEQIVRSDGSFVTRFITAVLLSSVPVLASALWQTLHGGIYNPYSTETRIQGPFVHPNVLGTYLGLIIAIAAGTRSLLPRRMRIATLPIIAGSFVCLLFTYARGAWLACLAAVAVIILRKNAKLIFPSALVVLVVFFTVPSVSSRFSDLDKQRVEGAGDPNSVSWRFRYWGEVFPLVQTNVVSGIGLSMVAETTQERQPPHNTYLQTLVETGLIGAAALLLLIRTNLKSVSRALRNGHPLAMSAAAAAVVYLVQMVSENLLLQAALLPIVLIPVVLTSTPVAVRYRRASSRSRQDSSAQDPDVLPLQDVVDPLI